MKNILVSFALLSLTMAKAQLWIRNPSKFADLKAKGVYVVMTDTTSEVNNAYWNIYKKYWTYSPVRFVSYEDMDKYIEPGNYFFTMIRSAFKLEDIEKVVNFKYYLYSRIKRIFTKKLDDDWVHLYTCSLQLWEHNGLHRSGLKDDILNGKIRLFDVGSKHITSIAGVFLFSTEEKAYYAGDYDKDGKPHMPKLTFYTECNYAGNDKNGNSIYFNWSEGLLKNYLQGFTSYIEQNKNFFDINLVCGKDIFVKDKMEPLKQDTLFIPDFAFTEYIATNKSHGIPLLVAKQNIDAKDKQNMKSICEAYKYPCKIISSQELSNKLLYDTKPFFYLMYVVCNNFKQITVISSATGENIYYRLSPKKIPTVEDYNGTLSSDIRNIKLLTSDMSILHAKMQTK